MKQEYDKEIDSLLRRGARLAAAGPRGAERARAASPSSHLDADELSAFAENALPAPARLAAASHLADCDECRGLVVQLSSASGAAAEIERREPAAAVTPLVADAAVTPVNVADKAAPSEAPWWQTLFGTLFAPRVLRYAAPVLVLGLVGVVSLLALRPWSGSVPGDLARKEAAGTAATSTAPPNTQTPGANDATDTGQSPGGPSDATATDGDDVSPVAETTTGPVAPQNAKPDARPVAGQPSEPVLLDGLSTADRDASPAESAAGLAAAKKEGPAGESVRENKAAAAPENIVVLPAPPPVAKSAGTEVTEQPKGARGADTARNKEPESSYIYNDSAQAERSRAAQSRSRNQQEVQMPDGGGTPRNDTRAMNNRGNVGGTYPAPGARAEQRPAARRARPEDAKARDSAGEDDETVRVESTRSVAGRRFRREGSKWVDVNYKTSMSMTGVRRGTEGYRALVADIPELGRIAEQLGGEVVAVVKGRAYRIH